MIKTDEILVGTKQEIIDFLSKKDNLNLLSIDFSVAPQVTPLDINTQLEKIMTRKGGIGLVFYIAYENINSSNSIPELNIVLKQQYVHITFDAKKICKIEKIED